MIRDRIVHRSVDISSALIRWDRSRKIGYIDLDYYESFAEFLVFEKRGPGRGALTESSWGKTARLVFLFFFLQENTE